MINFHLISTQLEIGLFHQREHDQNALSRTRTTSSSAWNQTSMLPGIKSFPQQNWDKKNLKCLPLKKEATNDRKWRSRATKLQSEAQNERRQCDAPVIETEKLDEFKIHLIYIRLELTPLKA